MTELIDEAEAMEIVKSFISECRSQRKAADKLSVCHQFVWDVLHSKTKKLHNIMERLGYERVTLYRLKETQ